MNTKVSVFAFFAITSLSAQTHNSENILDELLIEEKRVEIPFLYNSRDIQIITRADIEQSTAKSINELLAYVSGVDIRQRGPFGAQADISIDGGSFEQTVVLWNGIKMSDAQTAHHSMNLPIPLHTIERIEILKGPAARVYGINALTGAVNIVTKTSYQNFINAHTYAGSSFTKKENDEGIYVNGGVEVSTGFSSDKTQHLVAFSKEETNGQRYNTAAKNTKIFYQGNYLVNTTNSINALAGYIYNAFGANGYYAAPHDRESYEVVETLLVSLGSEHRIADKWTFKPRLSNRYNTDDYRFYRYDLSRARSKHYSNAFTAEAKLDYQSTIGDFGLGYEARWEDINSSNIGEHARFNQGWFTEYKNSWQNKLWITLGAYLNHNSDYGFQWYPGVDLAYQFMPHWKSTISVGSSQRIPSFTDLYLDQRPGNIGNPELKPESAWQYEIGVNYANNNKNFVLSLFNRNIHDFIDWTRVDDSVPYQPFNLGEHNMLGGQVRWSQTLKPQENQNFSYRISYQYLSPKKNDNEGVISKYVLESLKHQFILTTNYQWQSVGIHLNNRYIKRELNDGYIVTDLKVDFQKDAWKIYTQVSNLFNAQYKEVAAVPMPNRWFTIGVNYKLNI